MDLTPQQVADLQAANEQQARQLADYAEQVRALGQFRKEALDSRETIAALNEKVASAQKANEALTRELSNAKSDLSAASLKAASDDAAVRAAADLVRALRTLLG